MKVTSTRQVHITLDEKEATGIVNALHSILIYLKTDAHYAPELDQQGLLLKLKTELTNAPR